MACSHEDGRQPTFELPAGNRVDEPDHGAAREARIPQVAFPPRWAIRLVTPENATETRACRLPFQFDQKQIRHLHVVGLLSLSIHSRM
jgi:hypothetical protein